MKSFQCVYHPDVQVVTKCEHCGKMICLECKSIYRKTHRSSSSNHSSSYTVRKEFCLQCHKKQVEQDANSSTFGGIIFGIVGCIMFMMFIAGVSSMGGNLMEGPGAGMFGVFTFFFVVVLVVTVAVGIYTGTTQKEKAAELEDRIQYNTSKKPEISRSQKKVAAPVKKESPKTLYCQQCGHQMSGDALFCPNCGDTSNDEHAIMD